MKAQEKYRQLYNCLLESGEIKGMRMSGDWEADKDKFIKYQKELEQLVNVIEVDDSE